MRMAWRNILAAAALLAFSAWYAWLATGLPERSLPNTPGPSFFPLLIVAFIALLSAALLYKGIMGLRTQEKSTRDGVPTRTAWFMLAAFAIYLTLLPVAGFILASIGFFAVLMLLYGERRPAVIALASTGVTVLLFLIFRYGFQIVLPRGLLDF